MFKDTTNFELLPLSAMNWSGTEKQCTAEITPAQPGDGSVHIPQCPVPEKLVPDVQKPRNKHHVYKQHFHCYAIVAHSDRAWAVSTSQQDLLPRSPHKDKDSKTQQPRPACTDKSNQRKSCVVPEMEIFISVKQKWPLSFLLTQRLLTD